MDTYFTDMFGTTVVIPFQSAITYQSDVMTIVYAASITTSPRR